MSRTFLTLPPHRGQLQSIPTSRILSQMLRNRLWDTRLIQNEAEPLRLPTKLSVQPIDFIPMNQSAAAWDAFALGPAAVQPLHTIETGD